MFWCFDSSFDKANFTFVNRQKILFHNGHFSVCPVSKSWCGFVLNSFQKFVREIKFEVFLNINIRQVMFFFFAFTFVRFRCFFVFNVFFVFSSFIRLLFWLKNFSRVHMLSTAMIYNRSRFPLANERRKLQLEWGFLTKVPCILQKYLLLNLKRACVYVVLSTVTTIKSRATNMRA